MLMRDLTIHLRAKSSLVAALVLVLAVLSLSAYWILREFRASRALTSWDRARIERATLLVPDEAAYHHHLGRWEELSLAPGNLERAVASYRRATELKPQEAEYWLDLANGLATLGRSAEAESTALRAARADPNGSRTLWGVGNFWLRTENPRRALPHFRQALPGDPDLARPVIEACHRTFADPDLIAREVLPPEPRFLFVYLWHLVREQDTSGALRVWQALLAQRKPFDIRWGVGFVDYLISAGRLEEAEKAWDELQRLQASRLANPGDGELLNNADLRTPVLNGGFDWRIESHPHARAALGQGRHGAGSAAVVIEFSGEDNLECRCFSQLVPVRPHSQYRFEAWMMSTGISSDSGPRLEVADAYDGSGPSARSASLLGTNQWQRISVSVATGPRTRLVRAGIVRLKSDRAHGQVRGTVRATEFSFRAAAAEE
jgi:tetratricopeptide (TPR) repeat protein